MRFILLFLVFLSAINPVLAKEVNPPKEYIEWLETLKNKMVQQGIKKSVIDAVYKDKNFYKAKAKIIQKDRNQLEFSVTSADYINKLLSTKRYLKAKQKYEELYPKYKFIEEKYGVPFALLVAFWAIETDCGTKTGEQNIFEALTVLSYDKRRADYFQKELFNALKIVQDNNINPDELKGSWAGASGHFQFMPSTYLSYAKALDENKAPDIWNNLDDAFLSAANFVKKLKYNAGQPWGQEVKLPWNFDYNLASLNIKKPIIFWKSKGIRIKLKQVDEQSLASIIVPEGKFGKAYLLLDNHFVIKKWNKSQNYALAVGILKDCLENRKVWRGVETDKKTILKTDDIKFVQRFINKQKLAKLNVNGKLDLKTIKAVKKLQKMAFMPQDGYPDYRLIRKIRYYKPWLGFKVPVPPIKPV